MGRMVFQPPLEATTPKDISSSIREQTSGAQREATERVYG